MYHLAVKRIIKIFGTDHCHIRIQLHVQVHFTIIIENCESGDPELPKK